MSGLANIVFPDLGQPDRAVVALLLAGFDVFESADPYHHLGRFRGSWFEKDDEGLICAFYTRNGGGNRECVHYEGGFEQADERCKHETYTEMGKDFKFIPEGREVPEGYEKSKNIITGGGGYYTSIEDIELTKMRCLSPDSAECFCYGCAISYRLPEMEGFLSADDDDFDSTYATIRFRGKPREEAPGLYEVALEGAKDEAVDMSAKWGEALAKMTEAHRD